MKPIIPSSADIIVPAIAELVSQRPRAAAALNVGQGNYATIIAGLRAQANLAIARLTEGVVGNNLKLGKGDQLLSYVSSEFERPPSTSATRAFGYCFFDRVLSTGTFPAGVIKKGHKLHQTPVPDAPAPLGAWDFEVAEDFPVAQGAINALYVPIISVREGPGGNIPAIVNSATYYNTLTSVDKLFDKDLKPTVYYASGGSTGFDDDDVRRYARAFATGQYGPTDDALILAALRSGLGVKRAVVLGNSVCVADASWSANSVWTDAIKQAMLADGILGYATRFDVNAIPSYPVTVALTVRLRDTSDLSNTTDISTKIRAAVQSYLDDRDDFYVVSADALRAVVSRADSRILRCTVASINFLDGTPFSNPSKVLLHAYLANNSTTLTFLPPV